ncbi:hypothetical protein WMY93_022864 [Mugilogobius chulae]|uniref:Resistance to inhibitors of cholinesterase protein 3 N-terminal domain-containing protein n=1 Tax=Mugilogobius chulae TaxID=88201 RepID=A0AAW0N4C5_9GOBI
METNLNHTTAYVSPSTHAATSTNAQNSHGFYALIPIVLATLVALVMLMYFKRKSQLDELRHRMLPLYRYDPAEHDEHEDLNYDSEEDEGKKGLLHKYGRLSVNSDYGADKLKQCPDWLCLDGPPQLLLAVCKKQF